MNALIKLGINSRKSLDVGSIFAVMKMQAYDLFSLEVAEEQNWASCVPELVLKKQKMEHEWALAEKKETIDVIIKKNVAKQKIIES